MKIEIKNRFGGHIILSGDYPSIKDCIEKNRGADLGGAYLGGADLGGAYLGGAYLGGAYLGGAYLGGAYLGDAYLGDADLGGAYLGDADLGGAYLGGAYLGDARNYCNSHDVFAEAVRRQPVALFVDAEWSAIGQIVIHRLCWDSIKKRFANVIPHVFSVLADAGFPEWRDYWEKINK